jgi:hypothetical protein
MAIWQYNFIVIPKSVFDRKDGSLENYLDAEGFLDDESCWLFEPVEVDFFEEMKKVLPENKSWSNDIILFGNQDSNRLEVYKNESNQVISVSFRIDYTTEYEDILRSIIRFIELNDLAILDENLELLDNNFITIKTHIENSDRRNILRRLFEKD